MENTFQERFDLWLTDLKFALSETRPDLHIHKIGRDGIFVSVGPTLENAGLGVADQPPGAQVSTQPEAATTGMAEEFTAALFLHVGEQPISRFSLNEIGLSDAAAAILKHFR